MKHRILLLAAVAALVGPGAAQAKSARLDIEQLSYDTVHDAARRGVIALDGQGRPLTFLLRIDKGQVLPPHGANGGVRLLTVISGTLFWGDGDRMDPRAERTFGPGSVIVVPAQGGEHWAAARKDDVLLQAVVVGDGALTPEAAAQVTP
ncbi:hypothetical protein [Phenylobacterium sp.]|jgi:quercetin dioxygenase-like cupin family protein|uniref:hypothetical protein n=1 Tax=Phenylobacterium sp. TaxID=1871053 RepID=UPI0035AEBDA4